MTIHEHPHGMKRVTGCRFLRHEETFHSRPPIHRGNAFTWARRSYKESDTP